MMLVLFITLVTVTIMGFVAHGVASMECGELKEQNKDLIRQLQQFNGGRAVYCHRWNGWDYAKDKVADEVNPNI